MSSLGHTRLALTGGITGPKRAAVQVWDKSPGPLGIALTAGRVPTRNTDNATQDMDHGPWGPVKEDNKNGAQLPVMAPLIPGDQSERPLAADSSARRKHSH